MAPAPGSRTRRDLLDGVASCVACSVSKVTRTTPHRVPGDEPHDRRIRRTWRFLLGSFVALGILFTFRIATVGGLPIDVAVAFVLVLVGCAAILHRNAFLALETGRRAEVESFARILRGLSRSVSPDAIVDAIVEELGHGTGADHIVVVRRRPDASALEATLVSSSAGVASSTTLFPLSDLEDIRAPGSSPKTSPESAPVELDVTAAGGTHAAAAARGVLATDPAVVSRASWRNAIDALLGLRSAVPPAARSTATGAVHASAADDAAHDRIVEQVAARVRTVYGLKHTLAAPLRTERGVIGAIVLSRRTAEAWPASTERILAGAADEAAAALARAFSHRDAETRASTDALTGLPNRRYFDEFCGLLARRRRAEDAVGVLMVDIDRFKSLNDTYGHAVGDQVLREVGSAIAGAVREDDVPARFGGEEFAVLLRNPTSDMAIEVGERVRAAVGALDLSRFGVERVSVSVGVAVGGVPERQIADLVVDADRALYEAKRLGRDRVVAG